MMALSRTIISMFSRFFVVVDILRKEKDEEGQKDEQRKLLDEEGRVSLIATSTGEP